MSWNAERVIPQFSSEIQRDRGEIRVKSRSPASSPERETCPSICLVQVSSPFLFPVFVHHVVIVNVVFVNFMRHVHSTGTF